MKQRAYQGEADQAAMAALVTEHPNDNLHVVDLPYRFCSWAFDDPANVGLWVDGAGQLLAWAVMQTPFWSLDFAYSPDAGSGALTTILAWADGRARESLGTAYGRPAWFANVFENQLDRQRDLELAGFTSQANAGENAWSKVLMLRPAGAPRDDAPLPPGFAIRPLAGASEVEAYVALHQAVF